MAYSPGYLTLGSYMPLAQAPPFPLASQGNYSEGIGLKGAPEGMGDTPLGISLWGATCPLLKLPLPSLLKVLGEDKVKVGP